MTPVEPTGIETPVGSILDSPPSFYQTPMQTMPSYADPTSPPTEVVSSASLVIFSDKKRKPTVSDNDSTTAQKGGGEYGLLFFFYYYFRNYSVRYLWICFSESVISNFLIFVKKKKILD
jgi:hypothetical protein